MLSARIFFNNLLTSLLTNNCTFCDSGHSLDLIVFAQKKHATPVEPQILARYPRSIVECMPNIYR